MRDDLELKLQEEFAFMWQNNVDEEKHLYRRWGCECSSGWYDIIHDCCKQIEERYAQDDVEIDFEPAQIKEKWGTLRFYYGYKDSPCGIAAMDFIESGISIRFDPEKEDYATDSVDASKNRMLREDIAKIVRKAEARSKSTCEYCGDTDTAELRTDLGGRVLTLCNSCVDKYKERVEKNRKERREMLKEIYDKVSNNNNEQGD